MCVILITQGQRRHIAWSSITILTLSLMSVLYKLYWSVISSVQLVAPFLSTNRAGKFGAIYTKGKRFTHEARTCRRVPIHVQN